MTKPTWLDWTTLILVIVGGLNWGLQALGWNLVEAIFGAGSTLTNIIYGLVGLSAIYVIFMVKKMMKSPSVM